MHLSLLESIVDWVSNADMALTTCEPRRCRGDLPAGVRAVLCRWVLFIIRFGMGGGCEKHKREGGEAWKMRPLRLSFQRQGWM